MEYYVEKRETYGDYAVRRRGGKRANSLCPPHLRQPACDGSRTRRKNARINLTDATMRRPAITAAAIGARMAPAIATTHRISSAMVLTLTNFWAEFPFGELAALKDRLRDILRFDVTSAAEELPGTPERIKRLAKRLEGEALKIPQDVPL